MNIATQRSIFRWIHLIVSIPILGYIYSPFEEIPKYAPPGSVCRRSRNAPFGIVDVERPCSSTTYFEKIGPVICMRSRAGKSGECTTKLSYAQLCRPKIPPYDSNFVRLLLGFG